MIVMEKTKERFINFRPLLIIALMLCMSVVFMVEIYSNLLMLIPAIVLFLFFIVVCLIKKKYVFMAITLFIYLIGFGLTSFTIETYSTNFDRENCVIYGRVANVVSSGYEGGYYLILKNVEIDINDETENLRGKVSASVYGATENKISIGDILSCKTKISNIKIIEDDEVNVNYYHDDIRYHCSLTYKNISLIDGSLNIIEKLKENSKDSLTEFMGEDVGGISYAVLFGDKSLIESDTKTSFRESGIAHVLAVSGLHVGFLFSLLYLFLNKIPINRWFRFLILVICLFSYCFVCEFSPSVVRASIMCLCLMFTRLLGKQYDSLSSISLAFIIIVLCRPLFIYDIGFQMSFGAVLGSILVLKAIDRFNFKNKFVKGLVSGISVSIATQLGIIPIIANSFGFVATYSIFANIITIPLFGIFYPLLCIANLFVLISSFFNFLYFVPLSLMNTIISISDIVSSLPFAYVEIFTMGVVGTLLFYITLFALGGFVNLKGMIKILSITALSCLTIMSVVINNMPFVFTSNNFVVSKDMPYYATINTNNNSLYLIDIDTSKEGLKRLRKLLNKKKINKIDGLVFINNLDFSSAEISTFVKDFNATIYLPTGHTSISNLLLLDIKLVEYDDSKMIYFDFGTMQTFLSSNGKIVEFEIENKKFLLTSGEFSSSDLDKLKDEIVYPIYMVCYNEDSSVLKEERVFNSNYYLYYGEECDIVI